VKANATRMIPLSCQHSGQEITDNGDGTYRVVCNHCWTNQSSVHPVNCTPIPETSKPEPCKHPRAFVGSGYEGGYSTEWCRKCGKLTYQSDGWIRAEQHRHDFMDWIKDNVVAFGCAAETRGGVPCKQYCGGSLCVVSLRDAHQTEVG